MTIRQIKEKVGQIHKAFVCGTFTSIEFLRCDTSYDCLLVKVYVRALKISEQMSQMTSKISKHLCSTIYYSPGDKGLNH